MYLLKSTNDREKIGDVIINKNEIESLKATKMICKKEVYYILIISLKSKDYWKAAFNTEEEIREEMYNLGVDRSDAYEYLINEVKEVVIEQGLEDLFRKTILDNHNNDKVPPYSFN